MARFELLLTFGEKTEFELFGFAVVQQSICGGQQWAGYLPLGVKAL